jgi:hypothetical protein
MDAVAGGTQLSLMDYRTKRKTALLTIPDSITQDVTRATPGVWVWVPLDGRALNLRSDGDSRTRKFSVPPWYANVGSPDASPDGRSIAFAGWKAVSFDSIGIGILSLADGRFSQVWTTVGDIGGVRWLNDGYLEIAIFDSRESLTFYRARGPGNIERLGRIPRPVTQSSESRDLRNIVVSTRDRHADAWVSKVVR